MKLSQSHREYGSFRKSILITMLVYLMSFSQADEICRALALRGGGTKGAYEVGVLLGFLKHLKPEDMAYDVVVGVSIGAINGAIMALYEKGDEKSAIAKLVEMWTTYKSDDFWSFWPYVHLAGGLIYDAFLDSKNMRNVLEETMKGRTFKRSFSWQAVDLNTGSVVIFDETVPDELKAAAVLSSASIPGAFSPIEIGELLLVDGGTFDSLDLAEAIVKCRKKGFKDENIVVDMILCYPGPIGVPHWSYEDAKWKNSWDLHQRKNDLKEYYSFQEDVERVMRGFHHIKFRYIVSPSSQIPAASVPIYWTPEDIQY